MFAGDSLTVGNGSSVSRLVPNGSKSNATWTFADLIIANLSIFNVMYNNGTLNLAGSLTFSGGSAEIIDNCGYATALNLTAALHGSGNVAVTQSKAAQYHVTYRFQGDAGDYTGTLTVGNDLAFTTDYLKKVLLGDNAPRKVALTSCGGVGVCGAADLVGCTSLDELTLSQDSTLYIGVTDTTNSTIRVVDTYSAPGDPGSIRLDLNLPDENAVQRRLPILIVPVDSGLVDAAFRFVASSAANAARSAACSLEVQPDGQGNDVLYLIISKYTYQKTGDGYKSGTLNTSWLPAYFNHWNTAPAGDTLDPETIYLDYNKANYPPANGNNTFGGKGLVLVSGSASLNLRVGTINVDDLALMDGAVINNEASGPVVNGHIRLLCPQGGEWATTLKCSDNWNGTVNSDISGDGGLKILGNTTYTLRVYGDNSAFSGKVWLTNSANHPETNMTVIVTNACALGGAMALFTYDGLKLDHWSILRTTGDVALTNATRGVYVEGGAIVEVNNANDTLTFASQTTMAGELVKRGAGTLALGGTTAFTEEQTNVPLDGTNVLTMSAGRLRPVSKYGADGLFIRFAAGTGLRFRPLEETDSDVMQYGLYDVACSIPFDLTQTGGTLDVAVDLPAGHRRSFSFGICTVAESYSYSLSGNINLPDIAGYEKSIVTDSVPGRVTFRAVYKAHGSVLIFE